MADTDLRAVSRLTAGPDLVEVRPPLLRRVARWWVPRRVLAFAVIAPMVLWLLASASTAHPVLLLVVSAGVALSLTTYVPLPGDSLPAILGSPCSALGGVLPMGCAAASLVRTPDAWVIAIGFVALGLYQRLGPGSCGVR